MKLNTKITIKTQRNKINSDHLEDILSPELSCLYEDVEKLKAIGINAIVVEENEILNKDGLRNASK